MVIGIGRNRMFHHGAPVPKLPMYGNCKALFIFVVVGIIDFILCIGMNRMFHHGAPVPELLMVICKALFIFNVVIGYIDFIFCSSGAGRLSQLTKSSWWHTSKVLFQVTPENFVQLSEMKVSFCCTSCVRNVLHSCRYL